jgi:hypothetical protein
MGQDMRVYFLRFLSTGLVLCALSHLLAPAQTDRLMSQPKHVRAAGAVLLAMVAPSVALELYTLGFLLGAFGLPRLVAPERSIRLQQRLYPRRVHGLLLLAAAVGIWIFSSRP